MAAKKTAAKKTTTATAGRRGRTTKPYPNVPFSEVLPLAQAIHTAAAGMRARRMTILEHMGKSPTSSASRTLITNSNKYGLTTGSYNAEHLDLTADGRTASSPDVGPDERLRAQFKLAIDAIAPFQHLYELYAGKKLPSTQVMKDNLADSDVDATDVPECVDIFVVNAKELGILKTIAGAETLLTVDAALASPGGDGAAAASMPASVTAKVDHVRSVGGNDWSKTCFYVTPIGADGSEQRQHADLLLNSLTVSVKAVVGFS